MPSARRRSSSVGRRASSPSAHQVLGPSDAANHQNPTPSRPMTIDSTTKSTREKAIKRRRSLLQRRDSSKRNLLHPAESSDAENENPQAAVPRTPTRRSSRRNNNNDDEDAESVSGTTPYWKVCEERGGIPSPPLTRSAKKKRQKTDDGSLPPRSGVVLSFSPPDQKANAKREKEELERKELERAQRIEAARKEQMNFSPPNQEENARREREELKRKEELRARRIEAAKKNGQLLVFSTTNWDAIPTASHDNDDSDDTMAEEKLESTSDDTASPPPNDTTKSNETDDDRDTTKSNETDNERLVDESAPTERESDSKEKLDSLSGSKESGSGSKTESDSPPPPLDSEPNKATSGLPPAYTGNVSITSITDTVVVTELRQMRSSIESLRAHQREEQKELLAKLEEDLSSAQQEISCLTQQKEITQARLKDSETEVTALRSDKEHSERKEHELTLRIRQLEEQQHELTLRIRQLEEQLQALTQQKEFTQARLKDAETEISALRSDKEHSEREEHELTLRVHQLEEQVQAAESTISAFRSDKEDLGREKHDLSLRNKQLESENARLNESATALDQALQVRGQELNDAREEMSRDKETYRAIKKQLESVSLDSSVQLRNMEQAVKEKEQELCDEKRKHQEVVESLKTELQKSQSDNKALTDRCEHLESRNTELTEEVNFVENQWMPEVESQLQAEKDKASHLEACKRDCEQIIEELNTTQSELKEQLSSTKANMEQVISEKKIAEVKLSEVSKQLKTNEKTQQQSDNVVAKIEEMLATATEKNSGLQEEVLFLQTQNKELEKKLAYTQQRVETFDIREEELFQKLQLSDRVRRDMHNKIMQLCGNIRVIVRIRQYLPGELGKKLSIGGESPGALTRKRKLDNAQLESSEDLFCFPGIYDRANRNFDNVAGAGDVTKNIIELKEPRKYRGGLNERRKKWTFGFDRVFSPEHSQEDVWEAAEPLVQSAIDGHNVTIFAYGQTGSGKTYTMLGEPGREGIVGRAVAKLFEGKQEIETLSRGDTKVEISTEVLEIYNEQVRDLLAMKDSEAVLKVTSNNVIGKVKMMVATERELMGSLEAALDRRCVKATLSNNESSRSHLLITIHFVAKTEGGITTKGKINICDLAGSERLGKSGANEHVGGALVNETKKINSSLSVLSNVIEKLQSNNPNVPYRESKLTYLLQNSLGGNSKTLAVICCSPAATHFHESLCSLRFAEKANRVELKAISNFTC